MILQTELVPMAPTYYYQEQRQRRKGMKSTHKSLLLWHVVLACYYLCNHLCAADASRPEFTLLDLTHQFDNSTIYWVTQKSLTLNVTHNGTVDSGGYWYQVDEFAAATHGGTHMDAPCHFARGRWCVSDIPLDRLVARAAVVDIARKVQNDPSVHLTKKDLLEWEASHGPIPKGSLLLVRTGWARFWPDPISYSGTDQKEVSMLSFPSILPEAAEWLVAERDIVGVGIDTMSVDVPATRPLTHTTLMERNIYGLENVDIPDALPATGATVFVMPMKLRYASGAPCRIVAQVPRGTSSSAHCKMCSPNAVLAVLALYFCVLFWTKQD